jgi:hypothetical protein
MVKLRCNSCSHLQNARCAKLNKELPNDTAKLQLGGVIGTAVQEAKYASKCGIEQILQKALGQAELEQAITFVVADKLTQDSPFID